MSKWFNFVIKERTSNWSIASLLLRLRQIREMWNRNHNHQMLASPNARLPVITSHCNWTFHGWSNERIVTLASFHRGRGVQIRTICKTTYNFHLDASYRVLVLHLVLPYMHYSLWLAWLSNCNKYSNTM